MLDALRKFFQTRAGNAVAALVGLAGLVVIILVIRNTFGETEAEAFSTDRVFMDAATGTHFRYELKVGDTIPVMAPSGKNVGYPAESCYWTKDGKAKQEPTYVLLNSYKTPGSREPTFCPDCGRLVVGHNPAPGPDVKPPPTKAEYKPRSGPSEER